MRDVVEVVPGFVWALIAALAALSILSAGVSSWLARRARRLARQREELVADVGLLQSALLPAAPAQVAGAVASAAYRPATRGPAGGDFHDVFAIGEDRLGVIVGRTSATGRRALGVTALIRHVLRAYLEGGLQPRSALRVGADVLARHLGADYAAVTLATYDGATSQLTYASAGMPAPAVAGVAAFEAVDVVSPPPAGMGVPTGTRQTTLALAPGAVACFFTEGLLDAARGGERSGYRGVWHHLSRLDDAAGAAELVDRVGGDGPLSPGAACEVAVVMLRVGEGAPAAGRPADLRVEELELTPGDLDGRRAAEFLRECGVPSDGIEPTVEQARETARRTGGAVLRVRVGPGVPEPETVLRVPDALEPA